MPALRGDSQFLLESGWAHAISSTRLFLCSMAGMEQISLPAPPSQSEEIPAHAIIGTAQLSQGDTTAETQAGSAGAMSMAMVPEGLGTAAAWLTELSLPLTYRHLHTHGQQTTPRYLTKKDCGTWPVLLIPKLEEKFTHSAHTHVPPFPTQQAGKPHINKA